MKVLVDYDNAGSAGLNGINELKKADEIYIFYREGSRLSFDLHRNLEKSVCKKYYQKTVSDTDSSIGVLLSTIFGNMVAADTRSEYAIISRNNDYDAVISYWKNNSIKISKFSSVKEMTDNRLKTDKSAQNSSENAVEENETKKEIKKLTEEINHLLNIRN